ncbi:MAG: homocysteine S-methyltransferase family protein [Acidimicrobiia bacterium]|nr:homocysteine S-methyltransferase family protein [Acidimicrobiia bacterium]
MDDRFGILERLASGVVVGDGGYLLELEHRGYVQAGPYTPEVVLEHPDAVRQLHREFRQAGSEVLQALTFYAADDKLQPRWGSRMTDEVNRAAVRLAREVACPDALVSGTVTQTTTYVPGDPASDRRAGVSFARQLDAQCDEGVDFVIAETFRYLGEARLALAAIVERGVPAMITLNVGPRGTGDGVDGPECARTLAGEGAAIVGVNCNWDPDMSLRVAAAMRAAVPAGAYVACQPVGFRTADPARPFTALEEFPLSLERLQLTRFDLARFAREAADAGIGYIGGCCGVGAYHVRAMAEALGRHPPASEKSPDLSRHVLPDVQARALPPPEPATLCGRIDESAVQVP